MPNTIRQFTRYLPIVVAFVLVYFETFYWIASSWNSYQGSHGPIILAISLYIIWKKKDLIGSMNASPNILSGIVLTTAGCLLLISGRLGSILLLQYLSLIITLLGLVVLFGGLDYLKALWFPIVYLIFMFPIFSEILSIFSIQLQTVAAWIASSVLNIAGISVFRHGVFLDLSTANLEVARECNGINHIMALVSLAIPLAHWTQNTRIKYFIMIISAFIIGVIANGLRVAIIGFLALYKPGGPLHGPYDLFYVSFIFFFGMFFLMALSSLLSSKKSKSSVHTSASNIINHYTVSPLIITTSLISGLAILILAGIHLFLLKPKPVYLIKPIEQFPYKVGNWTGSDVKFTEYPLIYFLADNEIKRIYRDHEGHQITLYIGYFPSQGQEKEIVHYRFDPLQMNAKEIPLNTDIGITNINMSIPDKMNVNRSIYFWYNINGKILTNRYAAKIQTIRDAFIRRRTNASIVVIAVDGSNKEKFDIDFVKEVFPVAQSYLGNL